MKAREPFRAHGWTAHEFRIMLNECAIKVDKKIRCFDCGRVFIVALPTYLPDNLCRSCYERPCNASLRG